MHDGLLARELRIEERTELERWATADDGDRARRARIVLMASQGRTARDVADTCGSHPANVKKWIRRFNEKGISGLDELKRGPKKGSRVRFTEEHEAAIFALADKEPRDLGLDFDGWSPQKLADAAVAHGIVDGISHVTVRQMLRKRDTLRAEASRPNGDESQAGDDAPQAEVPSRVIALIDSGQAALDGSDHRLAADKFRHALGMPGLSAATEALLRCRLAQALEGLARYDEALDAIRKYDESAVLSSLPAGIRALVKVRLGWLYSWLRNYPRAIARLNEAIKIYRESEDHEGLAEGHYALGRTYMEIHESSMARDHLQRAIDLRRYTTDRDFLAQVYLRLGTVEFNEGALAKASDYWERARELSKDSNDETLLGMIHINLGVMRIHADRGERDLATRDLEEAIRHLEHSDHRPLLSIAYNNLGDNLRHVGEWDRAIQVLERAHELAREVGNVRALADSLITTSEIVMRQGEYGEARDKVTKAFELLRKIDDRWGESYALRVLAGIYQREEQPALALKTVRDALHLSTVIKDLRGVTSSHLLLAELHIAEGRYEQAEEYIELARGALKTDSSQLRSSGLAQRLSGRLDLVRGRGAEAQQQIAQSISIFTAVADLYEIATSHFEMASLHTRTGETALATMHLDQAIEIFERLRAAPDLSRARELRTRPTGPVRLPVRAFGAAASAPAVVDHKASDVLLMQRLIDASASWDLLLQELVSIIGENFDPGRILMLKQEHEEAPRVELAHGFSESEIDSFAREVTWAITSGGRLAVGTVHVLDVGSGIHVYLYLERAVPSERLKPLLRQVEFGLENCALREMSRRAPEPVPNPSRVETVIPGFILASGAMREVLGRIHKIRTSDVTVLITGESGTGKELVARAIHAESERRRAVFLPFNCTAMPKEIIDSQLFGHRRGSFTGATSNYPGIIRAAEGGTLFLDEIGDLALEVQPKLLRFLESGEIQPLGEAKPQKVDVRVVAATNTELERAVDEGRFREDLFHRLNIIRIHVPALRDRREEIPTLAEYFLRHFSERHGKGSLSLTMDAMNALTNYVWPGNVRQLKNEMERVVAYAVAGTKITSNDLSPELLAGAVRRNAAPAAAAADPGDAQSASQNRGLAQSLKEATALFERRLIEEALERHGRNLSRVAQELGVSRRGLHLKMSQLGIL